ncbi:hypothetical protein LUZ61_013920 [Rhynchospora tenuis]|uniref:Arabidopsis retrotransposon Orf1 C-terminal domain-containing protein n=1 Tax=Rhynchospora tenuis TaxID=198213 RepID=A0AAD5Z2Z1_9POAL|nr:hypothetical protein LUZ61_013920 [Rhynchospora tenuis]
MPRTKNLSFGGIAKRLRSFVFGASSSRRDPTPSPSRSSSQSMDEGDDEILGLIFCTSTKMTEAVHYFQTKKIENTRFVDLDTIEKMGILEDFLHVTQKGGVERRFWDIRRPTYKRLTVEFLASLEVKVEDDEHVIHYRLLDNDYSSTASEISELFGFTPGDEFKGKIDEDLWRYMTGMNERPSEQPKGKYIQHPVFRMIQRGLGHTIFARGESAAKMRKEEFMVMTRMAFGAIYKQLDLAVMMIKYWEKVAKGRRAGEGQITMGGYITCLAELKGIDPVRLEQLTEATAPSLMDAPYLRSIEFLAGPDEGPWAWRNHVREPVPLPLSWRFSLREESTWLMPPATGAAGSDAPHHRIPPQYQTPPPSNPFGASSSRPQPQQVPQEFDYSAFVANMQEIARLSNESLELGRRISDKVDSIEREQAAARRDINFLLEKEKEDEVARTKVNEMYDWLFPHYGPKPELRYCCCLCYFADFGRFGVILDSKRAWKMMKTAAASFLADPPGFGRTDRTRLELKMIKSSLPGFRRTRQDLDGPARNGRACRFGRQFLVQEARPALETPWLAPRMRPWVD